MLKIISKNNNFKVVVIVIFILAIFQNFGFAKNIFKILDQNPNIVKINSRLKLKYMNKDFQKKIKNFTKF